ncbi:MAG: SAV_2336 N-terminal domain-related protein, partial [Nodosilinea sp.]
MKSPPPQIQTVTDLATLLERVDLPLDADALADALWLAQFLPAAAPQVEPTTPAPEPQACADTVIIERRVDTGGGADSLPVVPAPAPADRQETEAPTPRGIPIQLPAAPALRSRRQLARALRPLMRQVPSRTVTRFDAEATAEQIAEQGLWTAVMAPAPERWFDLAIVVEQSRSTPLWQDTLAELKRLTERQGAFRRVSTWHIRHQEGGPVLHRRWYEADRAAPVCHPKALIDPAGRRLIWLVSDCTSTLWEQPQIYEWLGIWGQGGPTTLVQLFPGRLWSRTALGDGLPVQLSTLTPGVPNRQWRVREVLPISQMAKELQTEPGAARLNLEKFQMAAVATVPVVSLEAYPLQQWARVVAGGDAHTPGFRFNEATRQAYHQRKQVAASAPPHPLSPQARVQRFYHTASETAVKLAGLMAAAPVSPPIIQLIQATLLPESQQVHVAEVYMGGLLKAITPLDLPPHQIQYDFLDDEVRDALTDLTSRPKTEAVWDALSSYISQRLGLQAHTYEALLLLDWQGIAQAETELVPFARIAKRALRRMGGDYAALADHIDAPDRPRVKPFKPPAPDFPELKTMEFDYAVITLENSPEPEALEQFSFETVLVDPQGTVVERIQGTAQFFVEPLGPSPSDPGPRPSPKRKHSKPGLPINEALFLEMVAIPAGTFLMGSSEEEVDRYDDEGPQHEVRVASFFMAKYPITQAQWQVVAQLERVSRDLDPDPARFKGDNRPVEQVSWHEVTEFCARLSRLTGREYRLPSEAEWEYACRAGTPTPFHVGETITTDLANYNGNN